MSSPSKRSAADRLVDIAHQCFRFGLNMDGEPFAVAKTGANVARLIGSQEEDGFRAFLAKQYRQAHNRVASKSQLTDAIQVLIGECLDAPMEPCFRRVAPCCDGGVAVDLGRPDGKTVIIYPNGPERWSVVERSPVLFHRSPLTGEMPLPIKGGSLDEIPKALQLQDKHWTLLLGWILAAYERDTPHPILAIFGPAGAGKSCLARAVVGLCDPSPCPLRSMPHTDEQWHLTASSGWVSAMDNVSEIKAWLADALCMAATGNSRVVRRLFSSKGLSVSSLKVPVILTAIEAGSLRSDFGDRLVMLELPRRDSTGFTRERELEAAIQQRIPFWLGALFDSVSRVMEQKPITKTPEHRSRMADFGHILACADAAGVTLRAYEEYMRNRQDTVREVAEGDELIGALAALLQKQPAGHWQGPATKLLQALDPHKPSDKPPGWPRAANLLSQRLRRLEPVLKDCGVRYSAHRESDSRLRLITLSLIKKDNPSSTSSARGRDTEKTHPTPLESPDDVGTIPGRLPNDWRGCSHTSSDGDRTMDERWATEGNRGSKPKTPGDAVSPGTLAGQAMALIICPRCCSRNVVDVLIHNGKSLRRDCADCGTFIDFPKWDVEPCQDLQEP